MSASVTIAASSVAISAAANAKASKAMHEACDAILATYDAQKADVQSMHQYADCVNNNHPQPMDQSDVLAAKVFIVIGIIGFIAGGLWGVREDGGPGIVVAGAILGAAVMPAAAALLVLVSYAIKFLFS